MRKNNWVALVALVIAVVALMLSYRVTPVDFKDYWGFVLGVLTLLVTLLIGWQIYNSIEIKKQLDNTKEKQLEIEKKMTEFNKSLIVMDSGLNFTQGLSNSNERPLSAYRDFINALDSAYDANNHTAVEDCYNNLQAMIQKLSQTLKTNENIEVKEIQIEKAINKLKQNSKYDEFSFRIQQIEKNRIKLFESLKAKDHDNSSNKG